MGENRSTPAGWLPPVAPGAGPRPPFDVPAPAPARPEPAVAAQGAGPAATGNPPAVWALVLSILALVLLLASLGTLFLVTLPCSAAAWVLSRRASDRVRRGETGWGAGQAAAALWMARIGVIAGVAAAVVLVALLASGFDLEQFRDDLQRELDDRRDRSGGDVRSGLEGLRAATGR